MKNVYYRSGEIDLIQKYVEYINFKREQFNKIALTSEEIVGVICNLSNKDIYCNNCEVILLACNKTILNNAIRALKQFNKILSKLDMTIDREPKDPFLEYVVRPDDLSQIQGFVKFDFI